jgi:hypothetical protein
LLVERALVIDILLYGHVHLVQLKWQHSENIIAMECVSTEENLIRLKVL